MNTDYKNSNYKHTDITEKIISAFYKVYNTLGFGFLEKVYANALMHQLVMDGLRVEKEKQIKVYYEEKMVGEYYADIMVEGK